MKPTPSLYLALLRGINVGGNNIIKMSALKASFEALAFTNVSTFIASGNVLFSSPLTSEDELEQKIEQALSKTFRYNSRLVVIAHDTLKRVVKEAPPEFNQDPAAYRCDVIFLKKPLTPAQAMKIVETREGVDKAYKGKHALYFSRLAA